MVPPCKRKIFFYLFMLNWLVQTPWRTWIVSNYFLDVVSLPSNAVHLTSLVIFIEMLLIYIYIYIPSFCIIYLYIPFMLLIHPLSMDHGIPQPTSQVMLASTSASMTCSEGLFLISRPLRVSSLHSRAHCESGTMGFCGWAFLATGSSSYIFSIIYQVWMCL